MKRIPITPRQKSPGELSEAERMKRYWQKREALKRPGMHPNRNTIALRPSKFNYDSGWAVENDA